MSNRRPRPPKRRLHSRQDRNRVHDRTRRGGRGYDGVTDAEIYRRDKWVCLMPACLCPDGRAIDPGLAGIQEPWAPSIDHIVPLALGGLDNARNKRAAHAKCNHEDNSGRQRDPAWRKFQSDQDRRLMTDQDPRKPPLMTWTVADALAGRGDRQAGLVIQALVTLAASQPGQPARTTSQPDQPSRPGRPGGDGVMTSQPASPASFSDLLAGGRQEPDEWHGEPHVLTVHAVTLPDGPFDDGELEYDLEHPPSCRQEETWPGCLAYACDVGYDEMEGGLAASLRYSGTPVTGPGTYRIQGWGRRIRVWDACGGYEYDRGTGVILPEDEAAGAPGTETS